MDTLPLYPHSGSPFTRPSRNHSSRLPATLDKVRYDDFCFDARPAPASARAWLDGSRLTRSIGTQLPMDPFKVSLGRSYDIVVHLHDVTEANVLR
ncbi:MAG TPA: erythromycin esterase family protein [Amycolatopsis sp.]|nr:erythromycin esterase family protein [Amycolatopsis sp.]